MTDREKRFIDEKFTDEGFDLPKTEELLKKLLFTISCSCVFL